MDAQLPQALERWLCEQGYDAQHVEDIGLRDAEDRVIWAQGMNMDAIILTKEKILPFVRRVMQPAR